MLRELETFEEFIYIANAMIPEWMSDLGMQIHNGMHLLSSCDDLNLGFWNGDLP